MSGVLSVQAPLRPPDRGIDGRHSAVVAPQAEELRLNLGTEWKRGRRVPRIKVVLPQHEFHKFFADIGHQDLQSLPNWREASGLRISVERCGGSGSAEQMAASCWAGLHHRRRSRAKLVAVPRCSCPVSKLADEFAYKSHTWPTSGPNTPAVDVKTPCALCRTLCTARNGIDQSP